MTEPDLTAQELLVAAIVDIAQRLPGGCQVAMGMRLDQSIRTLEQLYEKHELPMRPQLIAELTLWRSHAEEGVRLMERGYRLLDVVVEAVAADRD